MDFKNKVLTWLGKQLATMTDIDNEIIRQYGTCATAAATAAKVGTVSGFVRRAGSIVGLKFTNANTAVNPTLNVNGTGAAAIYYQGAAITPDMIPAGHAALFQFNGVQWELLNPNPAPNISLYDSKKSYKTGDIVCVNTTALNGGGIYAATSITPEATPYRAGPSFGTLSYDANLQHHVTASKFHWVNSRYANTGASSSIMAARRDEPIAGRPKIMPSIGSCSPVGVVGNILTSSVLDTVFFCIPFSNTVMPLIATDPTDEWTQPGTRTALIDAISRQYYATDGGYTQGIGTPHGGLASLFAVLNVASPAWAQAAMTRSGDWDSVRFIGTNVNLAIAAMSTASPIYDYWDGTAWTEHAWPSGTEEIIPGRNSHMVKTFGSGSSANVLFIFPADRNYCFYRTSSTSLTQHELPFVITPGMCFCYVTTQRGNRYMVAFTTGSQYFFCETTSPDTWYGPHTLEQSWTAQSGYPAVWCGAERGDGRIIFPRYYSTDVRPVAVNAGWRKIADAL